MELDKLIAVAEETFAANFVAYYQTHVAHVMIKSRSFYSDHKLLQKIYEYLFENVDGLAERIRTLRGSMPDSLNTVLAISPIADSPVMGDSEDMLRMVHDLMETLIDQYHALNDEAEAVDYIDISNFAQDVIGRLAKYRWQLEATLEDPQLP